jgi:hypothetical protein
MDFDVNVRATVHDIGIVRGIDANLFGALPG